MNYLNRVGGIGMKTIKFDTGRGGLVDLTHQDIIAASAGLDEVHSAYLFGFLVNSTSRRCVDRVVKYLSSMTELVKPEQAKGLAVVALNENAQPQCVACGGSGIQHNHSDSLSMMIEALPCPHCKGLGRKPMKIKDKAKLLGVHVNTYNNNKDLYENELSVMKSEIASIEQRINKHGKEKLG